MRFACAEETLGWLLLWIESLDAKSTPREPTGVYGWVAGVTDACEHALYGHLAAVLTNAVVETTGGGGSAKGWRQAWCETRAVCCGHDRQI